MSTVADLDPIVRPVTWRTRVVSGFLPPELPPVSRRAFRFHMAQMLLTAVFEGIIGNAPLMAVKAMGATDVQLQLPLAMTSAGLFASVFTGAAMAARRKMPFAVVPGIACAFSALLMAWMNSAIWFLALAGIISIFDFAMRPAVPSIMRIVYPHYCRSHVAGTMRQYSSIVFLVATLLSATLLSAADGHIHQMIRMQLTFAGVTGIIAFLCLAQLPDRGDGCIGEADLEEDNAPQPALAPFRDRQFLRYMAIFFVFGFSNLFHSGIVPAFFARDMGLGYVQATLLLHIIPSVTAFLAGGRLTAWFDRTSIWRSYGFVTLMWGLDPILLATAPASWPAVIAARIARGPAILGSMVLCFYTGVHRFAAPGRNTSRYMAALFLVNGMARLLAPAAAALALGFLSRRSILLCGGLGVLVASALFFHRDATSIRENS